MRQLRTCDFCGEDAVGAFEVVPPELAPTEAEQRRVVLCADCRATLNDLVEPLLARAGVESAGVDDVPDGLGGDEPADGSESTGDETAGTESDASSATSTAEPPEPNDEASTSDDTRESAADADDAASNDSSAGGEESAEPDGASDRSAATGPPPAAYGKVLRLLRNRDLPMARSDVEGLAAGAYELENHEVAAILDTAVDRGDLVEDDGRVRLS